MSCKLLSDKEIGELINDLSDLEVDSEEELICDENSEVEDQVLSSRKEDSSSSSSEDISDEHNDDESIQSRDGTNWKKSPPSFKRRTLKRNTLRVTPGLTDLSKNIDTQISAFRLLFDDSILNMIIAYTVLKRRQHNLVILN